MPGKLTLWCSRVSPGVSRPSAEAISPSPAPRRLTQPFTNPKRLSESADEDLAVVASRRQR